MLMENLKAELLIFPQFATILLVVWSAKGDGSALTSKASSKVKLLNDDICQWVSATIIVSSFKQVEQGVHYINP